MKKWCDRIKELSVTDIPLIKLAVFFFSLWLIGLLAYWISPTVIMAFLIEWRWALFCLMIIAGIKPSWKFWFGRKCVEMPMPVKVKPKRKRR